MPRQCVFINLPRSECFGSCVQHMQRMPSLVNHLAQRPKESARFLHSLIRALLTDKIHTAASTDLLRQLIDRVDLGGLAQAAAQQILSSGPGLEGEEQQSLMSIFRWAAFLLCRILRGSCCISPAHCGYRDHHALLLLRSLLRSQVGASLGS